MEFTANKIEKDLVENAFKLRLSDFGKKLLKPINLPKNDDLPLPIGEEIELMGKNGSFTTSNGLKIIYLSFEVDLGKEPAVLNLKFTDKPENPFNRIGQSIKLRTQELTYGTRWYFLCRCGKRCNTLYLVADGDFFGCRICQNLIYEVSMINKNTMSGVFHFTSRLIKLAEKRDNIRSFFYKNKYTKKAQSYFHLQEKWGVGVNDEVKRFVELQLKLAAK